MTEIPDLSRWVTRRWPEQRLRRFAALWLEGAHRRAIGRAIGASISTVCVQRRRMAAVLPSRPVGWPPGKPRPRPREAGLAGWATPQWPEHRLRRLCELWRAGEPCSVIAGALGTTVNAVCAKRRKMAELLPARRAPVPLPRAWKRPTREELAAAAAELAAMSEAA